MAVSNFLRKEGLPMGKVLILFILYAVYKDIKEVRITIKK